MIYLKYSQFHKTLPRSSLQIHWISERFYEMGDIITLKLVREHVKKEKNNFFQMGYDPPHPQQSYKNLKLSSQKCLLSDTSKNHVC